MSAAVGVAVTAATTSSVGLLLVLAVGFAGVLEALVLWLLRSLAQSPKYVALVHKLTRQLAVVGLVYLLVKCAVLTERRQLRKEFIHDAFDAANMLLLVASLSMAVQAIVVIVLLRVATTEMDGLGLLWSFEVVDEIQLAKSRPTWLFVRNWHATRVKLKLVDAFFRHVYGLPPMFGFAKHVRGIQEQLTFELFDMGFGAWVVLLALFYTFFSITGELEAAYDLPPKQTTTIPLFSSRGRVFVCFSSSLMALATVFYIVMTWSYSRLVHHAKLHALVPSMDPPSQEGDGEKKTSSSIWDAIASFATKEGTVTQLGPLEALSRMQAVGERLEASLPTISPHDRTSHWAWRDEHPLTPLCRQTSLEQNVSTQIDCISLPIISYQSCRVLLQVILLVNGLGYAYFATTVLPFAPLDTIEETVQSIAAILPLVLVTVVLAPRLIRSLALVHSTWRVDSAVLARVIAQVVHIEHVKVAMVADVIAHCHLRHQSPQDMRRALVPDSVDRDNRECFVEADALRRVLRQFGHRITLHDMNALIRAMDVRTRGTCVSLVDILAIFDTQRHPPSEDETTPNNHPTSSRLFK
ncbi:hypothetical protein DYB28_009371, partial [Aphanomyces astaci]